MTEGRVIISLKSECSDSVDVRLHQPGNVNGLLTGYKPQDALAIVSALYSLCRTAQSHAAVTALELASNMNVDRQTQAKREALTCMEILREHILRIATDWPRLAGENPQPEIFCSTLRLERALGKCLNANGQLFRIAGTPAAIGGNPTSIIQQLQSMLELVIFAEPLTTWRERHGWPSLLDWARRENTIAARLLNHVAQKRWNELGNGALISLNGPPPLDFDDWFSTQVGLPGSRLIDTPETTVFSRQSTHPMLASLEGNGLGCRLIARLLELAQLPERIQQLIDGSGHQWGTTTRSWPGAGVAAVEAARGLLIHTAVLDSDLVKAYRIIPPTLWNFDANGTAKRCLTHVGGTSEQKLEQANLLINAIDPCVAHQVSMH